MGKAHHKAEVDSGVFLEPRLHVSGVHCAGNFIVVVHGSFVKSMAQTGTAYCMERNRILHRAGRGKQQYSGFLWLGASKLCTVAENLALPHETGGELHVTQGTTQIQIYKDHFTLPCQSLDFNAVCGTGIGVMLSWLWFRETHRLQ